MQPELPNETPGVRNSSRVKFQTKHDHITNMIGSKYAVTMPQLKYNGAIHLDAYMLFMQMQEEHPDDITEIMTQLSLKVGLK